MVKKRNSIYSKGYKSIGKNKSTESPQYSLTTYLNS